MILVYFDGHGEWFIRDDNSLKLAIPRTTKIPYQDTRHCADFEEWLNLKDDTADLTEWDHLYDSKNFKYDHYLKGIFVRDQDAEGDVFDTNGLRTFGPNYVDCPETDGVFRLTDKDEKRFKRINFSPRQDVEAFNKQWIEFVESIEELLPCDHPESCFSKMVKEGKLSDKDYDRVFFGIQTQQYFDYFGKSTPIIRKNELHLEKVDEEKDKNSETAKPPINLDNQNKSEYLSLLNQASLIFWKNADKADKGTWPDTDRIEKWLEDRGFTPSRAKKGASIIRPEWAGSGRRPQ